MRFPLLLAAVAFAVTLWTLPVWWCQRGSGAWYEGEASQQSKLAQTVSAQIKRGLSTDDYHTQSARFDGEWLFGTYLMAGIGLCQVVQQDPEALERWKPDIEECIRQLLSPAVREFDRRAWNQDALNSLSEDEGHAAYLGYLNFLLSLYRQILPQNEFASLNDSITETLLRRTRRSASGFVATYPDEWYPVDNCPILASIALHGLATGRDYSAFLARQALIFQKRALDPETGLLIQALDREGDQADLTRGSGSTLGLFFLTRVYPEIGARIFAGIEEKLVSGLFGFGAIREFPRGESGLTDIDSGPVIFGFGFSATGFGLAGARAYQNEELYSRLFASAVLAGAPAERRDSLEFLTGGPLGNAILLAMLTTPIVQP